MATGDSEQAALLQAIDEFNRRDFFACHETIEDRLWRPMAPGADRTFLQGVLQVGVGLHHLQHGNFTGARNLLTAGIEKLATTAHHTRFAQQLDIPTLLQESRMALAHLQGLGAEGIQEFPANSIPSIRRIQNTPSQ